MKLTFLGTGTSHGIPVIGCSCLVCLSQNQKNKRTRCSVWIETETSSFLIDTATEFRLQAIRENIKKIDFVLLTHSHADHLHGIDDLRPLSGEKNIPVYGNRNTIKDVKKRFTYILNKNIVGGGKPNLLFEAVKNNSTICPYPDGPIITPIPIKHGNLSILGYRIGSLAYLTDCSAIPTSSMKLLDGTKTLILGALRYRSHPTHFSINEAIEVIDKIGCTNAYLTHFCHDIDHEKIEKELPVHIAPAFDSLTINISD